MRPLVAKVLFGLLPLCVGQAAVAQVPLGLVVAKLPYSGKMLADPARPRLYMLQPADKQVISIDTTNFMVVGALSTGTGPSDLAITPERDLLYVSTGQKAKAISAIGLDDFVQQTSFAFSKGSVHIAVGAGRRLFLSAPSFGNYFYQVDGNTGALQATYTRTFDYTSYDELKATPDGNTLIASLVGYPSNVHPNSGKLRRFDISTETAVRGAESGDGGGFLAMSHDGNAVGVGIQPDGFNQNPVYASVAATHYLVDTQATYNLPSAAGPLAFSADDQVVYQTLADGNVVYLYDAHTSALLDTLPLPPVAEGAVDTASGYVEVDGTGSYLFVTQHGTAPDGTVIDRTLVIGTGRGSGLPTEKPSVGVTATKASVRAGSAGSANFTLIRTGDSSQPLTVAYTLGGTAVNGVDYKRLPGTKKMLAGQSSAVVRVIPAEDIGPETKTVTLDVNPKPDYDTHASSQAVITIKPHP